MREKIVSIGVVACLLAGPVAAADTASKAETIGVGMGATVGALAGGPVGFMMGAAIGAKIGERFHKKDSEVDRLNHSLAVSRSRISQLEKNSESLNDAIARLNGELQQMHAVSRPELLGLLQSGIEMDLLFRTGEHVLPLSTKTRLAELASSLAMMPDVHLRLHGFADERGDSRYNHDLSVQRAEFVRQVLQSQGVPGGRIEVTAHGESPAADSRADSLALERRVSVIMYLPETPALAANPERHP